MNVLHVITSVDLKHGGPSQALLGLTSAQAALGARPHVISTYRPGDDNSLADKLRAAGVEVTLIGPAPGKQVRHRQTRPLLERAMRQADVAHIHAMWEDVQHQAARAARRAGVPYLFRPCGMLDPWSLKHGSLAKRLYLALVLKKDLHRAAGIHFTAEAERDLAAPLGIRAPAIVEPNGIDLGEFAELPAQGAFRARYPQLAGRRIALFLSRIHPKKGLDLLIPAFARGAPDDVMLVLAGPDADDYSAQVRKWIIENNLEDRVIWTGMLRGRDRIEAYVDADLFVLPSYQENFGIVVVEALACGTPVLISDQVNIHGEILQNGVGGVVPATVDALAGEMKRWFGDRELLRAAILRSRSFALERYDWRMIARRWLDRYDALSRSARNRAGSAMR